MELGRGCLVVLLLAASGCPDESEPTTTSGSELTGSTGPTPATDTGSTSEATGMTETQGPVDVPWSDVPCDEGACVGTEVCVQPGVGCDYSPCRKGMEAEWINHSPGCQPFPDDCDPADPALCLAMAYCAYPESYAFEDGHLQCPPEADDCYCL